MAQPIFKGMDRRIPTRNLSVKLESLFYLSDFIGSTVRTANLPALLKFLATYLSTTSRTLIDHKNSPYPSKSSRIL